MAAGKVLSKLLSHLHCTLQITDRATTKPEADERAPLAATGRHAVPPGSPAVRLRTRLRGRRR